MMLRPVAAFRFGVVAAALAAGLAVAPAVFAADNSPNYAANPTPADPPFAGSTSMPEQIPAWQNPNAVVPWAVNRDGADEPTDPRTGIALPGAAQDLGSE